MDNSTLDALKARIMSGEARVGILGLGYVGLPLAVEFGAAGLKVTGFDLAQGKVDSLNRGESYIQDVESGRLKTLVDSGSVNATTDFTRISECDALIICVPTPLSKTKDPDLSMVVSATRRIAENMRSGQLVVLESTTYPGTTDELILPMLSEKGLKVGLDFFLAFSPERVDPGNPKFHTHNTPKVIGGMTPACLAACPNGQRRVNGACTACSQMSICLGECQGTCTSDLMAGCTTSRMNSACAAAAAAGPRRCTAAVANRT